MHAPNQDGTTRREQEQPVAAATQHPRAPTRPQMNRDLFEDKLHELYHAIAEDDVTTVKKVLGQQDMLALLQRNRHSEALLIAAYGRLETDQTEDLDIFDALLAAKMRVRNRRRNKDFFSKALIRALGLPLEIDLVHLLLDNRTLLNLNLHFESEAYPTALSEARRLTTFYPEESPKIIRRIEQIIGAQQGDPDHGSDGEGDDDTAANATTFGM